MHKVYVPALVYKRTRAVAASSASWGSQSSPFLASCVQPLSLPIHHQQPPSPHPMTVHESPVHTTISQSSYPTRQLVHPRESESDQTRARPSHIHDSGESGSHTPYRTASSRLGASTGSHRSVSETTAHQPTLVFETLSGV